MSVQATSNERKTPALRRWRIWIDGCGGFLLLPGNRWTVGGFDAQSNPDICVRADWPRRAGEIHREGADYFWQPNQDEKRRLISPGDVIPVPGSAKMTLQSPSPLSTSARLQLAAPHRFDGHVDGAVLVNETILIGPEKDCHIRAHESESRAILVHRAGNWQAKLVNEDQFRQLVIGERINLDNLAMTMEEA